MSSGDFEKVFKSKNNVRILLSRLDLEYGFLSNYSKRDEFVVIERDQNEQAFSWEKAKSYSETFKKHLIYLLWVFSKFSDSTIICHDVVVHVIFPFIRELDVYIENHAILGPYGRMKRMKSEFTNRFDIAVYSPLSTMKNHYIQLLTDSPFGEVNQKDKYSRKNMMEYCEILYYFKCTINRANVSYSGVDISLIIKNILKKCGILLSDDPDVLKRFGRNDCDHKNSFHEVTSIKIGSMTFKAGRLMRKKILKYCSQIFFILYTSEYSLILKSELTNLIRNVERRSSPDKICQQYALQLISVCCLFNLCDELKISQSISNVKSQNRSAKELTRKPNVDSSLSFMFEYLRLFLPTSSLSKDNENYLLEEYMYLKKHSKKHVSEYFQTLFFFGEKYLDPQVPKIREYLNSLYDSFKVYPEITLKSYDLPILKYYISLLLNTHGGKEKFENYDDEQKFDEAYFQRKFLQMFVHGVVQENVSFYLGSTSYKKYHWVRDEKGIVQGRISSNSIVSKKNNNSVRDKLSLIWESPELIRCCIFELLKTRIKDIEWDVQERNHAYPRIETGESAYLRKILNLFRSQPSLLLFFPFGVDGGDNDEENYSYISNSKDRNIVFEIIDCFWSPVRYNVDTVCDKYTWERNYHVRLRKILGESTLLKKKISFLLNFLTEFRDLLVISFSSLKKKHEEEEEECEGEEQEDDEKLKEESEISSLESLFGRRVVYSIPEEFLRRINGTIENAKFEKEFPFAYDDPSAYSFPGVETRDFFLSNHPRYDHTLFLKSFIAIFHKSFKEVFVPNLEQNVIRKNLKYRRCSEIQNFVYSDQKRTEDFERIITQNIEDGCGLIKGNIFDFLNNWYTFGSYCESDYRCDLNYDFLVPSSNLIATSISKLYSLDDDHFYPRKKMFSIVEFIGRNILLVFFENGEEIPPRHKDSIFDFLEFLSFRYIPKFAETCSRRFKDYSSLQGGLQCHSVSAFRFIEKFEYLLMNNERKYVIHEKEEMGFILIISSLLLNIMKIMQLQFQRSNSSCHINNKIVRFTLSILGKIITKYPETLFMEYKPPELKHTSHHRLLRQELLATFCLCCSSRLIRLAPIFSKIFGGERLVLDVLLVTLSRYFFICYQSRSEMDSRIFPDDLFLDLVKILFDTLVDKYWCCNYNNNLPLDMFRRTYNIYGSFVQSITFVDLANVRVPNTRPQKTVEYYRDLNQIYAYPRFKKVSLQIIKMILKKMGETRNNESSSSKDTFNLLSRFLSEDRFFSDASVQSDKDVSEENLGKFCVVSEGKSDDFLKKCGRIMRFPKRYCSILESLLHGINVQSDEPSQFFFSCELKMPRFSIILQDLEVIKSILHFIPSDSTRHIELYSDLIPRYYHPLENFITQDEYLIRCSLREIFQILKEKNVVFKEFHKKGMESTPIEVIEKALNDFEKIENYKNSLKKELKFYNSTIMED